MNKDELLYNGKAKQVYSTDNDDFIIISYKDDATAYGGIKKASILNKGKLNNKISSIIYNRLNEEGVPTHFVEYINERDQLCKKVTVFPIELIVRNIAAGTMAKRLGLNEGLVLSNTVYELTYKNDELDDPIINEHHAVLLNAATYEELNQMNQMAKKINDILVKAFDEVGVILVDLKLEFGKTEDGQILLCDEISPDTARMWDKETKVKLDKDRFRKDLGDIYAAYEEIYKRLQLVK